VSQYDEIFFQQVMYSGNINYTVLPTKCSQRQNSSFYIPVQCTLLNYQLYPFWHFHSLPGNYIIYFKF